MVKKLKRKYGIIKRVICLFLVAILCMSFCACSTDENEDGKDAEKVYKVGEKVTTDLFEYTLKNLEFVDTVKYPDDGEFFVPGSEGTKVIYPDESYKLVYFTFEMKYTGEDSLNVDLLNDNLFVPNAEGKNGTLPVGSYVSYMKEPFTEEDEWYIVSSNLNDSQLENAELPKSYLSGVTYEAEKIKDTTFEIRGVVNIALDENTTTEDLSMHFDLADNMEKTKGDFSGYEFKMA